MARLPCPLSTFCDQWTSLGVSCRHLQRCKRASPDEQELFESLVTSQPLTNILLAKTSTRLILSWRARNTVASLVGGIEVTWQRVRPPEVKNWGHCGLSRKAGTQEGAQVWEGSGACVAAKVSLTLGVWASGRSAAPVTSGTFYESGTGLSIL